MQLPHVSSATVDRAKVVDYLLSETHPAGRSKARFFRAFGFTPRRWRAMARLFVCTRWRMRSLGPGPPDSVSATR